jgi:hypothetical protein
VSPNFRLAPDVRTEADIVARAEIFAGAFDGTTESFVCGGHTFLPDGRLVVVGGTHIAKFATSPTGSAREFGLGYGNIFDATTGFVRIPRDFFGGESWYPTLVRLSDGRLLMYSGYYELEAPTAGALLTFNRTMQFYDGRSTSDPWTMLSPSASTPEGTEPANYTWIYELPTPISFAGKARQLLVMGSGGATFLMNHLDAFADPAARFVARSPRPSPPGSVAAEAATVLLAPYFLDTSKQAYRPGSILAIGGSSELATQESVDVYDPYVDQWCPGAAPLGIPRRNSVGVYLPDGNILIVNGQRLPPDADPTTMQLVPQVLNPRTGAVARGKPEPLSTVRGYHNVAILLPDGRVFVGGGRSAFRGNDEPDERSDAHFYSPYYLGVVPPSDRPRIVGIPEDPIMHYDADYAVDYANGEITGAALVGIGAMTHATDFDSRWIELALQGGGDRRGTVVLHGPRDGRLAAPGHYMLFLLRKVRNVDVPSVAQIIRVDGDSPTCEGSAVNECGGCRWLEHRPGAPCYDACGAGTFKCDGPNRTSCNACL